MKTTAEYIDEAKDKLGIESDYAFAKWLGITRASMSNYRQKRSNIDDYAAVKIAEALGLPPLQIIAAANAEREKDARKRAFWEGLAKGSTAAVLACGVIGTAVHDVRAMPSLATEYLLSASQDHHVPVHDLFFSMFAASGTMELKHEHEEVLADDFRLDPRDPIAR